MIKIMCEPGDFEVITSYFIDKLAWEIKGNKIQTLIADHWEDDLKEKLMDAIEETEDGFIFDRYDQLGEEPYGFLSDFFEGCLHIVEELKNEFPDIAIDGYVFVNEYGVYDCTMRQRVFCTSEMESVDFIDQLQCINCLEWFDVDSCHILIHDDDIETPMDEDGCSLLPNVYHNGDVDAAWCICSEECKYELLEHVAETVGVDASRELEDILIR